MAPQKKITNMASKSSTATAGGAIAKRARSHEPALAPTAKRVKNTELPQTANETVEPGGSPPPPTFSGNFDLYSHRLGFLSSVYLPNGTTTPQYDALYEKILTFQAKPDRTAQIYLAAESYESSSLHGCPYDPMAETPLDDIGLESVKLQQSLSLPKAKESFTSSTPRPGVIANIVLNGGHCGMQSLTGTLKMSRLWTKPVGGGNYVELFEGHITYNLKYSGLYARKGHGSGQNDSWSFWAVRAKVGADGFEVGIEEGIEPAIVNANLAAPAPSTLEVAPVTAAATLSNGPSVDAAPEFKGTFKFYSMSDVTDQGLETEPFPSYKKIYDYIAENNPDANLKCKFVPEDDLESEIDSHIRGKDLTDPFVEQPLQFDITSVKPQPLLSFTEEEMDEFVERDETLDPTGPGAIVKLKLADTRRCPSVYDGTGSIKIICAWAGCDAGGKLLEVYKAYLEYDLDVDPKAYRKASGLYTTSHSGGGAYWVIKAEGGEEESGSEDEGGCGGGFY